MRPVSRSARRLLCSLLSAVLAFHPLLQAGAQGITGDGGAKAPSVGAAPNGVPLIDITAPNQRGLSHNTYSDFNVDHRGVILNNSAVAGRSELGGIVNGNASLANGRAATVILNEVTSSNRSRLDGFTEVHGKAADVLVVNPNGITCDGCGFINTPRATLGTGRAVIDGEGRLSGLDVNGGDVLIHGRGADARRIDAFDIVSRRVVIEAPVEAGGSLNVITGRNTVGYADRSVSAKADDGSEKPVVAIDSQALGGMYAGRISLVSTEKGVGVTMRSDMAAHAGELTLSADGRLVLGKAAAAGDLQISSRSADVVLEQRLDSQGRANITAGRGKLRVAKEATLSADGGVALAAKEIAVQGRLQSQSTLTLKADGAIDNAGSLLAGRQIELDAARLDNAGIIQSNGLLSVRGATLDNAAGGSLLAQNAIDVRLDRLGNHGLIQSGGRLRLQAATLDNASGASLLAGEGIEGRLSASLINQGRIESALGLSLTSAVLDNRLQGLIHGAGALAVDAARVDNAGTLSSSGDLAVNAVGRLSSSGTIAAAGTVRLSSALVDNAGTVLSDDALIVRGGRVDNSGRLQTRTGIAIDLEGELLSSGAIETAGALRIDAQAVDQTGAGRIRGDGSVAITSGGGLDNKGLIWGGGPLVLRAGGLLDNQGTILGDGNIRIEADSLENALSVDGAGGLVLAVGDLSLGITGTIRNTEAVLMAGNDLIIAGLDGAGAGSVQNVSGLIEATAGDLIIAAGRVDNQRRQYAVIQHKGDLNESYRPVYTTGGNGKGDKYYVFRIINPIYGTEEFHEGQQSKNKDMLLWLRDVVQRLSDDSTVAGVLSAGRDLIIAADTLDNSLSEIVAGRNLEIAARRLDNEGVALHHIYYGNANWYWPVREGCWSNSGNPCVVIRGDYRENEIGRIERDEGKALILAGGDIRIAVDERFGNGVERQGVSQNEGVHQDFLSVLGQTAADRQTELDHFSVSSNALPGVPAGFVAQAALFRPGSPSSPYLYESRREFASFGSFYGSDYFLHTIGFDPDVQIKRLGDAYFDTRLVREQVLRQAGTRWLDDARGDDAAQMKFLLDNGVQAGQALALGVGVALSAAQQQALSSDIVWYVSEEIDGQTVLVPRLYLAPASLARAGAASGVISGADMLVTAGVIDNSDVLRSGGALFVEGVQGLNNLGGGIDAGGSLSLLSQGSITNLSQTAAFTSQGGQDSLVAATAWIRSGGDMVLDAGGDIVGRGGRIISGGDARLSAGGSVTLEAARTDNTYSASSRYGSYHSASVTHVGSSLGAEGNLVVVAQDRLGISGSGVFAGGDASLVGRQGVSVGAVVDESHIQTRETSSNGMRRSTTTIRSDSTRAIGSIIAAGGDLTLLSHGDVALAASTVQGGHDVLIAAGAGSEGRADASLTITAGQNTDFYEEKTRTSGFSFGGSALVGLGGGFGYVSNKSTLGQSGATTVASSIAAGNSLQLRASQDIVLSGAQLVAGNDARINAGRDVRLSTAEESSRHWQDSRSSGIGISFKPTSVFAGSTSSAASQRLDGRHSVGTAISVGNDLSIAAGRGAQISGAWLSAGNDLSIAAQTVGIQAADNHQSTRESHRQASFGLTLGLKGAIADAINTTVGSVQRLGQVEDSRLAGVLAGQAAYNAYKGGTSLSNALAASEKGPATEPAASGEGGGQGRPEPGLKLSVSLGGSVARSERTSSRNWATAATLAAGNDLSIVARGGEEADGALRIIGSDLRARGDIRLEAADSILIAAAREDSHLSGRNSSTGGSIGVSFGVGSNSSGLMLDLAANAARGRENGTATSWRESQVTAGGTLEVISGTDTTIRGGQLAGTTVGAAIGGDLLLQSLRDSESYKSRQSSGGVQVSVGPGSASGSGALAHDRIDSVYDSVNEQTGILAGDGGFSLDIGGHTQLDGAVIASTAAAENNRLETGTLGWSSIDNQAAYSASHFGVSVGSAADYYPVPDLGVGASGSASGTTSSAISEATIVIRDEAGQKQDLAALSRDTDAANAGAIDRIFDKKQVEERLEASRIFGQIANQIVGDVGTGMGWKADGPEKAALHGLIGALQAGIGGGSVLAGALAGAGSEFLAARINDYLADNPDLTAGQKAAIQHWAAAMAGASIGTAVTGTTAGALSGAATASDSVSYNYLFHYEAEELGALKEKMLSGQCGEGQSCTEEEKQAIRERIDALNALDVERNQDLDAACTWAPGSKVCARDYINIHMHPKTC